MTTIEKNKIIHYVQKGGKDSTISIKGLDWSVYDSFKCHLKTSMDIDSEVILDLPVTVDGDYLLVNITGEQTLQLPISRLFFDIKLILDDKVVDPVIPGEIRIVQTVTNIWN